MSLESYREKNSKKLKKGYTTGSTAAGAAKAAVKMLITRQKVETVEIDTPAGIKLKLKVESAIIEDEFSKASVIKDAGDDPDITDGVEIFAEARKIKDKIEILGGEGVGKVTKPGLAVEVGQAAINPIPKKMIIQEISKLLADDKGVRIIISVPQGEKLAEKTLNPKLGIKGGISILGTTGIVEPMSEKAYKESLALKINQAVALGEDKVVLVFGNYGKEVAQKLGYKEEQIIRMSNFVGFMLERVKEQEIREILLIGHIGKIVKIAAGIFNTHSKIADARRETIAAYTAALGGSRKLTNNILAANTAEETIDLIRQDGLEVVFDRLAEEVVNRVKEYIDNQIEVKSLIFSLNKEIIGKSFHQK